MSSSLVQFSNKISSHEFTLTITNTIEILETERKTNKIQNGKIKGNCIWLQVPENLAVIGDIHGDLQSLYKILDEINFEVFLANKNNKIIFLGDYIDRGSNSVAVLYTICKLKQTYPNSVILMRGNHEASEEFPFQSHDLPQRITEYFGEQNDKMYSVILSLFRLLTVMVLVEDNLLLVHGGLAPHISEPVEEMCFPTSKNNTFLLLEDMLWNDPRMLGDKKWETSRRPYGKHFGVDITQKWLDITHTKALVRGHEPCNGFRVDHDGIVLTLFSCKESYPKFEAGYLYMKYNEILSIHNATDMACHVRKIA
ncbi:putative serine/threonine-protein phosphatase [Nitrosotalea devaniterrae]|uniref:Putative serine/threonine-protein phosphatase n=1 Tax=Nitrosotalea devaniterrae TaxID=1078905 RepID=A0A128A4H0_9ARCH|nr:putative serine/threonine-protein phosphatase [Candidatus Nitrosotalea devanaterra]